MFNQYHFLKDKLWLNVNHYIIGETSGRRRDAVGRRVPYSPPCYAISEIGISLFSRESITIISGAANNPEIFMKTNGIAAVVSHHISVWVIPQAVSVSYYIHINAASSSSVTLLQNSCKFDTSSHPNICDCNCQFFQGCLG